MLNPVSFRLNPININCRLVSSPSFAGDKHVETVQPTTAQDDLKFFQDFVDAVEDKTLQVKSKDTHEAFCYEISSKSDFGYDLVRFDGSEGRGVIQFFKLAKNTSTPHNSRTYRFLYDGSEPFSKFDTRVPEHKKILDLVRRFISLCPPMDEHGRPKYFRP